LKPVVIWAATVLLLACPLARGDFRLFDDFEDEVIGPIHGQDGWASSGGDNRIVADPADPTNQVLYVPSDSSILRKSLLPGDLGVANGTVRMMFLRMRIGQKQTYSVGLSFLGYPTEYSDFGPEIGMSSSAQDLNLRVWDDDGDKYEILDQLEPDTWYNLWVLVDAHRDECALWMNDAPGVAATPLHQLTAPDGDETFGFRAGAWANLITFYIKTSGGASGENFGPVYFDDIYLEVTGALNFCPPPVPLAGDCDGDGGVDAADTATIETCLLGPGMTSPLECGCHDSDCDEDIDLADMAAVQTVFDG